LERLGALAERDAWIADRNSVEASIWQANDRLLSQRRPL
jgi:hypothetical protein